LTAQAKQLLADYNKKTGDIKKLRPKKCKADNDKLVQLGKDDIQNQKDLAALQKAVDPKNANGWPAKVKKCENDPLRKNRPTQAQVRSPSCVRMRACVSFVCAGRPWRVVQGKMPPGGLPA